MPNPMGRVGGPLLLAVLLLASALAPAASALDVSAKAIRVVGSNVYPDSVQSYAGEVSGSPEEFDGGEIGIAVLDTGVDDGHEAFASNAFAAGARVQHPCQPNDNDCVTDEGPNGDPENDCINPDDTDGHGTHVASIALAQGGAGVGPRGIAPGAKLIDVKIAGGVGGISLSGIERGIEWVIKYNDGKAPCQPHPPVSVISLSFGSLEPHDSKEYDAAMQAVRNATREGILVVAAAGNCGPGNADTSLGCVGSDGSSDTITSPGAAPEALTVGAVDDEDEVRRSEHAVAGYSSRGPNPANDSGERHWRKPDVVAPGTRIAAACATTTPSNTPQGGQAMDCNKTGTSMAVPHVSGLAAVLFQAIDAVPDTPPATPKRIKHLIRSTAWDLGPQGWDKAAGYGYVDGYEAIVKAVNRPPDSQFSASPTEPEPGEAVTFDASLSSDPDDQDQIVSFEWRFGDGTDPVRTTEVSIDHVFEEAGTYTVELVAVDEHGTADRDPFQVEIRVIAPEPEPEDRGDPPKPHLTIHPRSPRVGDEAVLDGSGTTDPDDDPIVRYAWDLDARRGSFEAERETDEPRVNWTFVQAGSRLIALKATDGRGLTETIYLGVHVRPAPPDPPIVNITNPQQGDTVAAGTALAAWSALHPVNNFTVYLDSVREAHLVQRQLRVDLTEGEHTLRVVARGPGGTGVAWSNFTAVDEEQLRSTSTDPCADQTQKWDCPEGSDGHDHADHEHDDANASNTTLAGPNEAPLPEILALVFAILATAVLARRP